MTMTSAWAPITKSEEQDDGTIFVYGKATDDALDRDLQRCDPNWLNEAMPEWYRTGANVREQHDGKRAVGVGIGHDIAPDGHYVKAHIVDPISVLKVKTGVLKGFSIGISNPKVSKSDGAPNGLIDGGSICELSLCDRPSNPGCQLNLVKAAKPGMKNLRPSDFDPRRMLVKCEELVESPDAAKSDGLELTVSLGERLSPAAAQKLESVASSATTAEPEVQKDDTSNVAAANDAAMSGGSGCGCCTSCICNPGTDSGKAAGFDRDAAMALIASTVEKADSGLGQDESGDISGALQAITIIAQLIQSEAKDLGDTPAQGCDIDLLMQAVHALRIFNCREAKEQAGIDPGPGPIMLAAQPDIEKAKYNAAQLQQMLKDGKAFKNPNGDPSYPIGDKQDLGDAIQAVGRGSGDHDAIRAYIKKRAAALGCSNMIPDNWTSSGSNGSSKSVEPEKEKTVEVDTVTDETVEKAESAEEVEETNSDVEKTAEPETTKAAVEPDGDALVKAFSAALEKADSPLRKTFEAIVEASSSVIQKSVSDLTERLTSVEQMATPGGPSLRRTEIERVQSRKGDLEREVVRYKALARDEDDRMLREGWLQKAAQHQAELRSL